MTEKKKQPMRDRTRDLAIRPKASMRKSRSNTVVHSARHPVQGRSQNRFEYIIKSTELLLKTQNIEDISFYDIARQAKISPSSINYLFPTMAALRIELSKRYNQIATDHAIETQESLARMRNPRWQDWIYQMGERARDEFNANRHICEVVLGPLLNRESRQANTEGNDKVGSSLLESFRRMFIVPDMPGLAHKFALTIEIADALWSRAYILNGCIDDDSFKESMRMQIAYLRSILPEVLPIAEHGRLPEERRRVALVK